PALSRAGVPPRQAMAYTRRAASVLHPPSAFPDNLNRDTWETARRCHQSLTYREFLRPLEPIRYSRTCLLPSRRVTALGLSDRTVPANPRCCEFWPATKIRTAGKLRSASGLRVSYVEQDSKF